MAQGSNSERGGSPGRRAEEDRRVQPDRRSGLDRRGSGLRLLLSIEPRAYGFREFGERRTSQDRRLYNAAGRPWDRRSTHGQHGAAGVDERALRLSHEELEGLLSEDPD